MVRRALTDADVQAIADAIADELQAREAPDPPAPAAILTAAQVASLLGRSRDWVYEHAHDLGAFRVGGPRGRLGFQRSVIDRWIREHTIAADRAPEPLGPPRRQSRRTAAPRVELIEFEEDRA